ncbi:cryptochrome/photolyase family protein [Algibacter amylolyticus]|uniref:Cryptochrome/photolyase family protein n=1 Tax=Algibacter amylolyticus TaxID=1608400 RepID=A0A5M7B162_9FLAO|nr:cryptochrome/photolyase family protein [Algibacter amylolyticus]KAA5823426.1 cryptochrome/photolyase family protein [Algibacter amylolyticus]MBB5267576.1 deoxyribodipyrimidine photolyase-related protein [Algibacter amylolyticus]TSJ73914.1 cryptochrome/photolyase family protein [Algibacter amylolyticus]
MKILRLILGDQLNIKHSWFKEPNDNVVYCLFEMRQETDYVTHHIQKVIGFFGAMRQFSEDLKDKGHHVVYYKINNSENTQSLTDNLLKVLEKHNIETFEYLEPDEYRLHQQLIEFCKTIDIQHSVSSTEHFYTNRNDLKTFFKGKKQYLMENFYRDMRKKHDILMHAGQPEGGKWNYDKSNRNRWKGDVDIPTYKLFKNNVDAVILDIEQSKIKTIGKFDTKTFSYPITRKQALEQLKYFCEALLIHFGDYQDAMHTDEVYLFHSRLSFAMNVKLISAKDVVKTVLNYYRKHGEDISISQVEGFIRQVIGWREYMRGMYWALMPGFKNENQLNNKNKLPDFFWTGNTKMNCLKQAITNSLDNGYAHHIQRLMITGNYALLTETHPDEVDKWYLGIYVDAVEWVQITNTRGMSQFSDGGKIATKPYVSSASYISKMSNYCDNCHYNKSKKTEYNACPFNSLYWNFLDSKRPELQNNFRMKMMYSVLDKMKAPDLAKLKERAQHIIAHQDEY